MFLGGVVHLPGRRAFLYLGHVHLAIGGADGKQEIWNRNRFFV